jgi:ABC-type multidrug transport system fused ATPase/permease subunit
MITGAATADPRTSVFELYRQMWAYAQGARGWLVLSSAMLVGSQLLKLAVPWFAAEAINTLQHASGSDGLAACLPSIGGIIAASLGCWMLHGPGRVIERSVAVRVRRALTDQLYARSTQAPLQWHEAHHPAELAHRMSQSSHALSNFTQSQFVYLQNGVNLVGPVVALALLSPLTGALAIASLIAISLTIVAFDRALMRLAHHENDAERRHAATLLDCLANVSTVLSLRLRETTRRLLARRLEASFVPLKKSIGLTEWKWCAVDLLTLVMTWSLAIIYAWHSSAAGALMLGSIFMVHQYAQQAGGVIGSLASNLQNFSRIRIDYASAAPIWNAPRAPQVERAAESSSPTWHHIDLCNLCFDRSPDVDAPLDDEPRGSLRNISLRLHAGERIALVGSSGSGKSTLLRLLAGHYAATRGHIETDGVSSLATRDLGHLSTLVPQEAQIFEASALENIAFDLPCSSEDIAAAARISSFDAVLAGLPQGLTTPIAQAGANLSGGQRQRLSLARGVLAARGSSVLLLDEPTSALDPVTEAQVYERIDQAFPNACIVASVHRMGLLDRFDRVVLMEHGHIVDCGTPAELFERQPLFRKMMGSDAEEADVEAATLTTPPPLRAAVL